jgi:hypothetical protein
MGIGEARGKARGKVMSAGHSLRRQNYSFVTLTPPVTHSSSSTTHTTHFPRVVVAIVSAAALELATLATAMMLITGR